MKQILVDTLNFHFSPQQINESIKANGGVLVVRGIIQRANAKNKNGRIYPRPILEKELKRYVTEQVKTSRALGELDHSDDSTISLRNASHKIVDIQWKGDEVIGTIEVLSTPSGNILKELFKSGVNVGISSRALGSVESIDEHTVQVKEDLEILCWDFVSTPSTHGAYTYPLNESISYTPKLTKTEKSVNNLINEILKELN